ncbi:DNA primase [Limosilactobacillus secaliphilus]|uniref:DNA primase n=1 Tax=Limosilactobacillus secaliphilus TaxID=396268 RepID=A0A0R2IA67_9LACO|nr:DNA primase [Limosilactobacillus secaliphilus]KRN58826.1 DNA primase [Limosilactobacillus secaliphilus]
MAKIPNELIDRIRDSVNIVDVISQDVQLRAQGKNLMGHCPFHRDDTPSFAVNEQKQFFYCFSCHRSGNVFGFLQQLHHLSFPEAVEKVAQMANISLPRQYEPGANEANSQTSQVGQLINLHQTAAKLYHHILVSTPAGGAALHYLQKRGMSRQLIDEFNLGFAPDGDEEVLLEYCQQQKLDYQLLRKSGLFVTDRAGNLHDRFHGRVMYPLDGSNGQVIGFSGRILASKGNDHEPKYLNSPETELFNKRQSLFNLHRAKKAARTAGKIILFEGFMDVISAFGAGVANGVASMGTSLTDEQVQIIQRFCNEVVVCYDGDDAGQNAIDRAIKLIAQDAPKLTIRVVQLPAGLDPDEYVQQKGAQSFQQYLEGHVETPVEFQLHYLRRGLNLHQQDELIGYLNAVLRIIAGVSSAVEQNVYLKELADEFGLTVASLQDQVKQIGQTLPKRPAQKAPTNFNAPVDDSPEPAADPHVVSKVEGAERRLLAYYLDDEEVRQHLDQLNGFQFAHDAYQKVYNAVRDYLAQNQKPSIAAILDQLPDDQSRSILSEVSNLKVDHDSTDEVVNDCIAVVMDEAPLKQQIQAKQAALNEAAMVNDEAATTKIAQELVQLYQKQQNMKTEEIG